MGLTHHSVGIRAIDSGLTIHKQFKNDRVVALAGNPNVGKSTIFNELTGLKQHTGNWPGKTVASAEGYYATAKNRYVLVDIPGTYSLMAHSAEEEVARNFLCFGQPDAVIVVCDATCLERHLNLVLQTLEICSNVVVCVNLMDEAARKHIRIDLKAISKRLGVPVVSTVARKKRDLSALMEQVDRSIEHQPLSPATVHYPPEIEAAIAVIQPHLPNSCADPKRRRWLSLKLLDRDPSLLSEIAGYYGDGFLENADLKAAIKDAEAGLLAAGFPPEKREDAIVSSLTKEAERICAGAVTFQTEKVSAADHRVDRILTSRVAGYPLMLLLLAVIFWITIVGANYPSSLLSQALFFVEDRLTELFIYLHAPDWLHGALVLGVYRVLAWVVSVMLPPMAIFFPLFTLLEDSGYLPRIAYNLDRPFQRCCACGKQALTMCMGFGCNAAGIVGCRIIDSPRERLLAILTNNFVPCNGRFPTLIALLTMFFIGTAGGALSSLYSALLLTGVILFGILTTLGATWLLSKTVLRGVPSSFTLELPPYRRPQIGKVIWRSLCDRTVFVLGRAVAVAAPAGLILWLMANITVGGNTLLNHGAEFLDPFARLMGLDGVILIGFILGFPANEIVLPIILMAYMAQGSLAELPDLMMMKTLLTDHGWTVHTAINVMLFSLLHWPCSTALITVKKETGSLKWTALAAVLPTAIGVLICMLTTFLFGLFTP